LKNIQLAVNVLYWLGLKVSGVNLQLERCVEVWLAGYEAEKGPLNRLDQFRRFVGAESFEELLRLPEPHRWIEDWRDGLKISSSGFYANTVRMFYVRHHIPVEELQGGRRKYYVARPHKSLTKEEIKRMIEVSGMRSKALIDSTLGLAVDRIDIHAEPPVRLHFYAAETKYNVEYDTFISAEAVEALREYVRIRARHGEKVEPGSPLFVSKYRRRLGYLGEYYEMKKIVDKAGVQFDPEKERLANHSFRGAFQHQLQVAGVNQFLIEKMMGHAVQKTMTGTYSRGVSVEELRTAHSQAEWSLDISEARVRELEVQVDETKMALGDEALSRSRLEKSYGEELAKLRADYDRLIRQNAEIKQNNLEEIRQTLADMRAKGEL
jgi:integrase